MPIVTPELRDIVINAIADEANLPLEDVHEDLDLLELGLDSLAFSSILIDIEDAIGDEVPTEVLDGFIELGDVITIRYVFDVLSRWDHMQGGFGGLRPQDEIIVVERP